MWSYRAERHLAAAPSAVRGAIAALARCRRFLAARRCLLLLPIAAGWHDRGAPAGIRARRPVDAAIVGAWSMVDRATVAAFCHGPPASAFPQPRHATIRCMSPADKLRAALELHEVGVELMRQNLRRRHPDASEDVIDDLLTDGLQTRPGAEHGDGAGRPSTRVPR